MSSVISIVSSVSGTSLYFEGDYRKIRGDYRKISFFSVKSRIVVQRCIDAAPVTIEFCSR